MEAYTEDCAGLLRHLAVAGSALSSIESRLLELAEAEGTDDILLVVHDPTIGRQVIRPGGAPLRSGWQRRTAAAAGAGLHVATAPSGWDPASSPLLAAATVALRLDRLDRNATTDPLTGVTNRRGFDRTLTRARERLDRTGTSLTIVFIDVDGMKAVNDRAGHAAGDSVLVDVARELVASSRVTDAVARFGGDEFALLLEDAAPGSEQLLLRRVERSVAAGAPAPVSLSWGSARAPDETRDLTELLELADARMYTAKERSRRPGVRV